MRKIQRKRTDIKQDAEDSKMEQEVLRREAESETKLSEASRWELLSVNGLKLLASGMILLNVIAICTAGQVIPNGFRIFGEMTGPLFAFLAAESFYHTSNKFKLLRRLFFANTMVGFGFLLLGNYSPYSTEAIMSNNYFGLNFVIGMYAWASECLREGMRKQSVKKILIGLLLGIAPLMNLILFLLAMDRGLDTGSGVALGFFAMLISVIPSVMTVIGGPQLILLGLLFYLCRKNRRIPLGILLIVSVLLGVLGTSILGFAGFAAVPIMLYNGKCGKDWRPIYYVGIPSLCLLIILFTGR